MAAVLVAAAALRPAAVLAHDPAASAIDEVTLWLARGLFAGAWLAYAVGACMRRPTRARRACAHTALAVGALALFGPLDAWAVRSTAMHMVQHMLLIVVVAPLLVLAAPLAQWRAAIGSGFDPLWRTSIRATRHPIACASVHAAVLWVWHAPAPYMAAVLHTGWHLVEHACFLGSAWLFWWAVLKAGRRERPRALLALLLTLMHTGLLGALLTFAREPLYWRESRELWDQQLAGLAMWVPGSTAYLLAAVLLSLRWLDARPGPHAGSSPAPRAVGARGAPAARPTRARDVR
ncbi:MAG: cytochrome c oxidase assembly protein [Lautropia sp.]